MRFGRLDLNLLVVLDALIMERSVSTAAKQLGVTQPAMSAALNRLRDYFEDDLLVQSGRKMLPTSRALELQEPVRDMLMLVASRIDTPRNFDPSTAERKFSILASDYMFDVLFARTLADLATTSPAVSFDFPATNRIDRDGLARGEIDLQVTLEALLLDDHPRSRLFADGHAVVAWNAGRYSESLSEQDFFDAGHVITLIGVDRRPPFAESYLMNHCQPRRIEVCMPNFTALPHSVVGTDRIATMYRRHAELFSHILPIKVHPIPFDMPEAEFYMQWHESRDSDPGLRWLRSTLLSQVNKQHGSP